jgi:hypothetical protein
MVSKPTDPAGQSPIAVLKFAAAMASRSLHLPGSGVSSLLVTVIVAAGAGMAVKPVRALKIKITTKTEVSLRVMSNLLPRS